MSEKNEHEREQSFEEAFNDELLSDSKARVCIVAHAELLRQLTRQVDSIAIATTAALVICYVLIRRLSMLEERMAALELLK